MTDQNVILGRLVQADNAGFIFSCSADALALVQQGQLVCANLGQIAEEYGIVSMISWSTDDFIQQIAQTASVHPGILADNQYQRLTGPAIQVLCVGYITNDPHAVIHTLPPQPALRLEQIQLCSPRQVRDFTGRSCTYLRLMVQTITPLPIGDLLGAHIRQMQPVHQAAGDPGWSARALRYIVHYLLNDPRLPDVVEAIVQTNPNLFNEVKHG